MTPLYVQLGATSRRQTTASSLRSRPLPSRAVAAGTNENDACTESPITVTRGLVAADAEPAAARSTIAAMMGAASFLMRS